jgi:hypothetical protein
MAEAVSFTAAAVFRVAGTQEVSTPAAADMAAGARFGSSPPLLTF